jgi:hypothetical protein
MPEKKNQYLDLTYDADGEAVIQQMVTESYHAGHINQNQPSEENSEQQ